MTIPTMTVPQAKGSTLHSTLAFIEREFGAEVRGSVLSALPADDRERVLAASATEEVPLALLRSLWSATDTVLGTREPHWPERSGAYSIEGMGAQMYSGILHKQSPLEFVTQPVSLFRLYYHPGDMEVAEADPGRVVLRLVGFDAGTTIFCRRQTGGLLRAVELAGGVRASVRHVRCQHDGDAFCEWELTWDAPGAGG
jgi:hypothetical protein